MERKLLALLDGFLGLTALGGVLGLLLGYTPPIDRLQGSLFASYTIPGLALMLLVGGSAMVATWLQSKRHPLGLQISLVSGLMLMAFEAVELLVVGYTWLLGCYVAVGLAIVALSLRQQFRHPKEGRRV